MDRIPFSAPDANTSGIDPRTNGMSIFRNLFSKGKSTDIASDDAGFIHAEPISRKRMDLLWLDPPRLAQLERPILEHGVISVVIGDNTNLRDHAVNLEDYQWARQVEKVVDKAFAASESDCYHDAIRYYKEALLLAPGCDLFLMSIGSCYACLGQKQKAIMYLERAAEISPGNTRIRENLKNARGM
jgi:tetratricopeptide (TPR) repeat protein